MSKDQSASRSERLTPQRIEELRAVILADRENWPSKAYPTEVNALCDMALASRSELTRSVAVKDMEIIGHREPGDAHKGRAWWSGGTWLQPGEVVAVLTLPKQDERDR